MLVSWTSRRMAASSRGMRPRRPPSWLARHVVVGVVLAGAGCTLKDPIMVMPPALLSNADVLPASGKSGGLLWNPPVTFGAFHTTEVRRGWRSESNWNWWGLEVDERWDASHATSFV